MITFVRFVSIMPGKTPDALAIAHKIKRHAKEKHGSEVNLMMPIGGIRIPSLTFLPPITWRTSRALWKRSRRTPNGRSSSPTTPATSFPVPSMTGSVGSLELMYATSGSTTPMR